MIIKQMFILLIMIFSVKTLSSNYPLVNLVDDAINNSNIIRYHQYKIDEAIYSKKEIELSKLGLIKFKSLYTKGDDPVYVFASKMKQHRFTMMDMMSINNPNSIGNMELAIEGGIPIFTGFKLKNYSNINDIVINANTKIYEEVKTSISFKVIYNYLTLAMYKKLFEFSSQVIHSSEIEIETAKKLNEKGMIFGSDYYAALSIFNILKNYNWEWKNSSLSYLKELEVLTGKNLTDSEVINNLKYIEIPLETEKYYIEKAINYKNEIKVYEDFIKISNLQFEIAKNSILPEIIGFVSFGGNTNSISDLKTSYMYGIKIDMPFGNPTYYEKLNKAKTVIKQNEELKKSKEKEIIEEIKKTYSEIVSARESIEITKQAIENAEKSVELFKPLYHQGKQSIMEVLRAEANLLEAKSKHIQAVYKYILMNVKLRYLTGELDKDFISKISNDLK